MILPAFPSLTNIPGLKCNFQEALDYNGNIFPRRGKDVVIAPLSLRKVSSLYGRHYLSGPFIENTCHASKYKNGTEEMEGESVVYLWRKGAGQR